MPVTPETQLVRCPSCGATNRIPAGRLREGIRAVCGRCKKPLAADARPIVVTDATFAREVQQSPLPVLLDLWAPWCGPCQTLAPVIEQLASELAGRIRVAKLNIDENPDTAARFNIRSIPTLLLLKQGREVDRIVGALPKHEILRRLQATD